MSVSGRFLIRSNLLRFRSTIKVRGDALTVSLLTFGAF